MEMGLEVELGRELWWRVRKRASGDGGRERDEIDRPVSSRVKRGSREDRWESSGDWTAATDAGQG